jgi:putative endonuclease
MLVCQDQGFYIGSTNNVSKRLMVHLSGKGASYTRSHKPVKIVYTEELIDKSSALKREHELKKLTHSQKRKLALL